MRSHLRALALSALVSGTLLTGTALAAPPQALTHQGRLYDQLDAPIDGTLKVVVALYDSAAAATPLWSETHMVTFDDGYFSVALGSATPFPAGLFDGSVRYLGITVGADPEMVPRSA